MIKKYFGITSLDEVISMFIGLGIVLTLGWFLFNYFRTEIAGNIDVPGISISLPSFDHKEQKLDSTVEFIEKVVDTKNLIIESAENDKYYTVQKGDSLWKIAKKEMGNGYLYLELAKLNNLSSSSLGLNRGQKILIPRQVNLKTNGLAKADTKVVLSAISIEGTTYTVSKGDSLAGIALRAYGDKFAWEKIWKANRNTISNPNLIFSGNTIVIPR